MPFDISIYATATPQAISARASSRRWRDVADELIGQTAELRLRDGGYFEAFRSHVDSTAFSARLELRRYFAPPPKHKQAKAVY